MSAAPVTTISPAISAAIAQHRVALAQQEAAGLLQGGLEDTALQTRTAADEAAFQAADEAFNEACQRQTATIHDLVAAPVATMADISAKANYLASVLQHVTFDNGIAALLLTSMTEFPEKPERADPLLGLIGAYRHGQAAYNESGHQSSEEDEALAEVTYRPAYQRLSSHCPCATTQAGAVAAIRLVAEELRSGDDGEFAEPVLRAALAYFEGVA